ncbi:transcriptional regulator [Haloechinothrix sp. LS1_15]|uniref:transcriptional regulator n=1 Tax=Haloechinothrix sp. LS1_15 TaxID=2652248 RepID=UPI002946578B|nr:transcriptional regulator [Haloechinothrix sp. LS1_15]MDV6012917.1 transcriptional regulator [Haloechinothrix sp. LS1_15]
MSAGSIVLRRRLVEAAVCTASLALSLALAWWQWEQYASTGGSLQNLGYVLQWPLFGLFPAFVFWRMRVLRKRAEHRGGQARRSSPASPNSPAPGDAQRHAARRAGPSERAGSRRSGSGAAEATGAGDAEEDAELAAYNRYLAELNARHQRGD